MGIAKLHILRDQKYLGTQILGPTMMDHRKYRTWILTGCRSEINLLIRKEIFQVVPLLLMMMEPIRKQVLRVSLFEAGLTALMKRMF